MPFRFRLFRFQPVGDVADRNGRKFTSNAASQSSLDLFRLMNQPAVQDRDTGRTVTERFLGSQRGGERQPVLLQRLMQQLRRQVQRPEPVPVSVDAAFQRLRQDRA